MYTTAKEARLRADALKSELAERRTIDLAFSFRDILHDQYHDKISDHRRISVNTPSSKWTIEEYDKDTLAQLIYEHEHATRARTSAPTATAHLRGASFRLGLVDQPSSR